MAFTIYMRSTLYTIVLSWILGHQIYMNDLTYVIISHSFLKITVVLRAKISAFEVKNVIILVKSDGI